MITPNESQEAWAHCHAVVRPALLLASRSYLQDVSDRLAVDGIQAAVARRDTPTLFDWTIRLIDRQGISNAAAVGYAAQHGNARWEDVEIGLAQRSRCSKLRSYWHFHECGYRKSAQTCDFPDLLPGCALPRLPARKGGLNQAAFSLALFFRDICGGDFVGWIDDRLAGADPGAGVSDRAAAMRLALLEPLTNIVGAGPKVWSMILAELLLGADPSRERWVTTGASFVAVDSLIHNHLHRIGVLHRLDAEHSYGACHGRAAAPKSSRRLLVRSMRESSTRPFRPAFRDGSSSRFGDFAQPTVSAFATGTKLTIASAVGSDFVRASRFAIEFRYLYKNARFSLIERLISNGRLDLSQFLCIVVGARGFGTEGP